MVKTVVRAPSLVDAVYDAIRGDILTGDIVAGTPLTEVGLATRYDVARPTAKAAMERLVHEGLMRRATNKSARVPVLGERDIRDLYFTRAMLEREVVRALARQRRVPSAAEDSLARFWTAAEKPVVTEIVRLDIEFHRALVSALASTRLDRMYASLMGEVHLCMAQVQAYHLLSPVTIATEHAEILNAVRDGDLDGVGDALTSHLERACQQLVTRLMVVV